MNKNRDNKDNDNHSPYLLFLILILLIMSDDIINIIKPITANLNNHRKKNLQTTDINHVENLKILPTLEKKDIENQKENK